MGFLGKIKSNIPNTITCLNLFSGCISSVASFSGHLRIAALLIGVAAVFDFFDGMAARLLKAHSSIGKELDSLADIISFGFAPAAILFKLMDKSVFLSNGYPVMGFHFDGIFLLLPFLITVFSGLRLAKFNIDTRQTKSFIGLPTPACGILIASLPLIAFGDAQHIISFIILNKYFLALMIFVLCFLLVCELPMFSLKMKNLSFGNNKNQYILILSAIVLIIIFKFAAIPLVIILYIVMSLIDYLFNKDRNEILS